MVSNGGEVEVAERDDESRGDAVDDAETKKKKYPNLAEKKTRVWNAFWTFCVKGKRSSFPESFAV